MKNLFYLLLLIIFCSSQSFAFDGKRQGFLTEIGIGYSNYNIRNNSTHKKIRDVNSLVFNISLGYSFDNKNPIVLETINMGKFIEKSNGFENKFKYYGLTWYHYFKHNKKSIFTVFSIGRYDFTYREKTNHTLQKFNGIGYISGLGYEFAKGKKIKLYYLYGSIVYGVSDGRFLIPCFSVLISFY